MTEAKRILGKILAEELTTQQLDTVSGGYTIVCNGCKVSTSTLSVPDGYPGCQCD